MGLKNSGSNTTACINRHIGTAYDKVAIVADNIDEVKAIGSVLGSSFKYLGASDVPPSVRLDGSAIQNGDYYFDSVNDALVYYDLDSNGWFVVDPEQVESHMEAAAVSESNAAVSESTASTKAAEASLSASEAATSAGIATAKAVEAANSAIAAQSVMTTGINDVPPTTNLYHGKPWTRCTDMKDFMWVEDTIGETSTGAWIEGSPSIGAPLMDHSKLVNRNAVGGHDAIYRRETTVSEIATGVFSVGDKLTVTDRGNAPFDIVSGGTADGYGVLNAGAGKTAKLQVSGSVTLRHLGAVNDGVTDSRWSFVYAAANYLSIEDCGGSYAVSGLIDIKDNQMWSLKNTKITNTSDTVHIFRAKGVNGWEIQGPLKLLGSATSPTDSDLGERGITIENCLRYRVSDLEASNFGGKAITVLGRVQPPINSETGQFSNIRSFNCFHSIDSSQGNAAEYTSWSNTSVGASRTGISITTGNVTMSGGSITNCLVDGLVLLSGGNSAHGVVANFSINHGLSNNIRCENINNGFTFQGCHTYANNSSGSGKFVLNNCIGINWNGGIIDSWIQVDESLGKVGYNQINSAYCPGGLGGNNLFDKNGDRPKGVIVLDCFGAGTKNPSNGNATINDAGQCYVNARRLSGNPQTLIPNAATTLVFNSVLSVGDNRRAYNSTTGEFTCPELLDGQYSIRANCIFTATALDLTNTYIDLLVNGASSGFFYAGSASSIAGGTFTIQVNADVYLDAGTTVKLDARIGSASAKFGSISLSNLTIQKLA